MSEYSENQVKDYQEKMEMFYHDQYSKDPDECLKAIIGCTQQHAAWRYLHIAHAVNAMGGFANFQAHCREITHEITGIWVERPVRKAKSKTEDQSHVPKKDDTHNRRGPRPGAQSQASLQ